jgi:hypothetical protein
VHLGKAGFAGVGVLGIIDCIGRRTARWLGSGSEPRMRESSRDH